MSESGDHGRLRRQPERENRLVVPVVQEEVDVGTRSVEREVLRIHRHTTIREETLRIPITSEHVDVRRVRVEAPVDGPVAPWRDGDTLVIPLVEQVPVVRMHWVVREEIRITRSVRHEQHERTVRLERREAEVEDRRHAHP